MRKSIKKAIAKYAKKKLGIIIYENLLELYLLRKSYRTGYLANNQIDKAMEKILPHENGYYVEVGANNGVRASNTYFFEKKKKWTGILIEPAPNLFLECLKNRSPRNKFYPVACVPFDYESKYVSMIYGDTMTISDSLDLILDDKIKFINESSKHLSEREINFEFSAKAMTLNSILLEAKSPKIIDFISIDTEGAELSVLSGIDFETFIFRYLVIETRDMEKISEYLKTFSYKLRARLSHHDYLYQYVL